MKNRFLRVWLALASVSLLNAAPVVDNGTPSKPEPERDVEVMRPKVALFVANRADKVFDNRVGALSDLVTARVTALGLSVIAKDISADALKGLGKSEPTTQTDALLAEQSSALRLSQQLGADYLMLVTLNSFDIAVRELNAYGVKAINETHTVRLAYRIVDGQTGASLVADTVSAEKLFQQTSTSATSQSDTLAGLLDNASAELGKALEARLAKAALPAPTKAAALVSVTIQAELSEMSLPEVTVGEGNVAQVTGATLKVKPVGVVVEVDGVVAGSAPGTLRLKPGLSKLRLTREGVRPWERTVNFTEGQTLSVSLETSPEAYAKWKDMTSFLHQIKNGDKLTDAQVKVLEGMGKMFEQSGYRIDSTEPPVINQKTLI